jgi:hypothetical protein
LYVTPANFIYRNNFPSLSDASIQGGIDYVGAAFPGIFRLFSQLNQPQQIQMQTVLENNLVGWFLANANPKAVTGIVNNGFPTTSKTIGGTKGTSLTFRQIDVQPGMEFLNTNFFGNEALRMFMSSPDRFGIFGRNRVGVTAGIGGGQGR